MKVNSRIELEFAGISLPIAKDADGREIVPVKPFCEVLGLDWKTQYKKMQTTYLTRRLGVCVVSIPYAGQLREMVCIRLDRVAAFLNQVNPTSVRGSGNEIGADFLEAKQCEWDDLLHEYESRQGGIISGMSDEARSKAIYVRLYLSTLRAKQGTTDDRDRKALSTLAETLAADAGAPYQPELTETK